MSKKIILLGVIMMCAFIYGCDSQKNIDEQQSNTENLGINDNESDIAWINETTEIPVAEKLDWEPIVVQWWGRNWDTVEIDETFEEDIK